VDDATDDGFSLVLTVDDADPVTASQPRAAPRGTPVDKKLARDRPGAQHLPVHIEQITAARVQAKPRGSFRRGRPVGDVLDAARDGHRQRRTASLEESPRKQRPRDGDADDDQTHNPDSPQRDHAHRAFAADRTLPTLKLRPRCRDQSLATVILEA
jgi:hypothetical protein